MNQRGVSLIELLLVLTLLALLGAGVTAVVRGASLVAVRAITALATERTATTTAIFLRHELRDAKWSSLAVAPDAITLGRQVGEGMACAGDSSTVVLGRDGWRGERTPAADRDRLMALRTDGSWAETAITAVVEDRCLDASPGWRLTMTPPLDSLTMLRVVEPTLLRRYRAGAYEWLGLQPADRASPVQPFAGPLLAGGVFQRVGDLLQVVLPTPAGVRVLALPLDTTP